MQLKGEPQFHKSIENKEIATHPADARKDGEGTARNDRRGKARRSAQRPMGGATRRIHRIRLWGEVNFSLGF